MKAFAACEALQYTLRNHRAHRGKPKGYTRHAVPSTLPPASHPQHHACHSRSPRSGTLQTGSLRHWPLGYLDNPPAPVVVFDALPKDEAHGWKFMKLSPDGNYLYFQIGTPANIVVQPVTHATIVRLNLKTNILETVAHGVRNSVGMDFHPVTKELWFTNNARDWVNDDLPNDTLHRLTRKGMNFGYPFCHQGDLLDIDHGKGRSCDEFDKPALKIGPHVAALGMRFYTGKQFPAEYKNNIFIAEHGSWNRTKKTGYDVVRVVLDAKGNVTKKEVFISGWATGEDYFGRPADVHVLKDGSMLVSDDVAGAIFRVTYAK